MPCLCASWGGGILAYSKSFATFNTHKEFNIIQGKIPNKNNGDVTLAVKLDGEKYKEVGFPSKEGHKFKGYECTNGGVLTWNPETWKASISEIDKPTVCILEFETVNGENFVTCLKETKEITIFNHEATVQTPALTDYRYTGSDPNNYIKFNNELWRIIGVFNTDDGTGNYEERVKIVRNESIGNMAWDSNGTTNWSNASLQKHLNGEYYNSFPKEAKNQIDNVKWYSGVSTNMTVAEQSYIIERNNTAYGDNPKSWLGFIGLIYPSDYGFSVSKTECLNKILREYKDETCKINWLLNTTTYTISHADEKNKFCIYGTGNVDGCAEGEFSIYPSLYLKNNVETTGGNGTRDNPYELS